MMIPFITRGGLGGGQSTDVNPVRIVNLVPQPEGEGSKSPVVLYSVAGTQTFSDLEQAGAGEDDVCRCIYTASNGTLFVVYGAKLYSVSAGGTAVVRYTLSGGTGQVWMADNGTWLVLSDGTLLLRIRLSNFEAFSCNVDFSNPQKVRFFRQRFYVNNLDPSAEKRNRLYYSELGASGPETWEALSFVTAEASADEITTFEVTAGEVWVFGPRSFEVYLPNADPDQPLLPVQGTQTGIGCTASGSAATIGGRVFWLGSSEAGLNQVYTANGYNPEKISTMSVEWLLQELGNGGNSDAVSFAYSQSGHTYYVLSLVTGNRTFVFDLTTGLWHERSTRNPINGAADRWSVIFASTAYDRVFVGSDRDPKVLELSYKDYSEHDGREIVRLYQCPVISSNLKDLFHKSLVVDFDAGQALQTGQGSDPKMMMQFSDDGGHSWSSEMTASTGKIGQYRRRVEFRRLGRSRERVYRISVSDPIPVTIIGANLEAVEGVR